MRHIGLHKVHTMNTLQGQAQLVSETVRTMAHRGQQPVLIWVPRENAAYDVYLCARSKTHWTALVTLGRTRGGTRDFSKSSVAWAATEAGASFRRFTGYAGPAKATVRVALPCGRVLHLV